MAKLKIDGYINVFEIYGVPTSGGVIYTERGESVLYKKSDVAKQARARCSSVSNYLDTVHINIEVDIQDTYATKKKKVVVKEEEADTSVKVVKKKETVVIRTQEEDLMTSNKTPEQKRLDELKSQ